MIIHYKKKVICNKSVPVCCENFYKTIETICPKFNNGINGHISIIHSQPFHEIWVTFYDKGKHENYSKGKTLSTKFNDRQKKYVGKLPTQTELEEL